MLQRHSMHLIACSATKLTEFVSTHVRVQRMFSISIRHFASITQAAAVITSSWRFGFEYDELEVYTMDVDVYCGDQYYLNGSPIRFDQKPWYIQSTAGEIFNYYTATAFNTVLQMQDLAMYKLIMCMKKVMRALQIT